jgi:hypothetical protein
MILAARILLLLLAHSHCSQHSSVLAGGDAGVAMKSWPSGWMKGKGQSKQLSASGSSAVYDALSASRRGGGAACCQGSSLGSCKPAGTNATHTYLAINPVQCECE